MAHDFSSPTYYCGANLGILGESTSSSLGGAAAQNPFTLGTGTSNVLYNSYPYSYYQLPNGQYGYQNIQYPIPQQLQPEPVKHITDIPEETVVAAIVAWRAWMVSPFTDELKSFNGTVWTPYEWLKAKCAATNCSGLNCTCGIYCMKQPEFLAEEGYGYSPSQRYNKVYGEVYLKGHILQCTKGYRASHAYPKSFIDTGVMARRMAQVFGVPVTPADQSGRPTKRVSEKVSAKIRAAIDAIADYKYEP